MKNLKYYIFGMTTILLIIPVLDKVCELVELWIESLKVKPQKRILEGNKNTALIREFLMPIKASDEYVDLDDFIDGND